jgi:hypothetical protein
MREILRHRRAIAVQRLKLAAAQATYASAIHRRIESGPEWHAFFSHVARRASLAARRARAEITRREEAITAAWVRVHGLD